MNTLERTTLKIFYSLHNNILDPNMKKSRYCLIKYLYLPSKQVSKNLKI